MQTAGKEKTMTVRKTKYPIYIISKGRSESRFTAKSLEEMNIDYKIVIEPQDYNDYAKVIDPQKILVTPFSNLGLGSIPVRNFVWEHSISEGHKKHWVLDDNIKYFYRLHKNTRFRVNSPICFTAIEDYTDRFENVMLSGMNYRSFSPVKDKKEPIYYNTRIYSCILINNEFDERWNVLQYNGKPAPFNEDTDLSLRVLKKGYCTLLFNQFLCDKMATLSMKGGNTEEVYKLKKESFDSRMTFAKSLQATHPDCVEVVQRYGRWHHFVDYTKFQVENIPKLKAGITWPEEYPIKLRLVELEDKNDMNSKQTPINIEDIQMEITHE